VLNAKGKKCVSDLHTLGQYPNQQEMGFLMGISAPFTFLEVFYSFQMERRTNVKNCCRKRNNCYLFSYTFFSPALTTFGTLKHNPFHTHFPGENQYETLI